MTHCGPVILAIIEDIRRNKPVELMEAKLHNALADRIPLNDGGISSLQIVSAWWQPLEDS